MILKLVGSIHSILESKEFVSNFHSAHAHIATQFSDPCFGFICSLTLNFVNLKNTYSSNHFLSFEFNSHCSNVLTYFSYEILEFFFLDVAPNKNKCHTLNATSESIKSLNEFSFRSQLNAQI